MADGLTNILSQGFDPTVPFARVAGVGQQQQRLNLLGQQEQRLAEAQTANIEAARQKAIADQKQAQLTGLKEQQDVLIKLGRTEDAMRLMPDVFKTMGANVPFDVEKLIEADKTKKINFGDLLNKATQILQDPKASQSTKQTAGKTLMSIIAEAGRPDGQVAGQVGVPQPTVTGQAGVPDLAQQVTPQAQISPQDRIRQARQQLLNIQQQFPQSQTAQGKAAIKTFEDQIKFEESRLPKTSIKTRPEAEFEIATKIAASKLGKDISQVTAAEAAEELKAIRRASPEERGKGETQVQQAKRLSGLKVKLPKARRALKNLARRTETVKETINEAIAIASPFTAGVGTITSILPASEARNLREKLQTIRANVGFRQLQEMRSASVTGGALGQVSEMENLLLQAVVASLDQGLHPSDLIANLNRISEDFDFYQKTADESLLLDFNEILPQSQQIAIEGITGGRQTTSGNRFTIKEIP